jgi:GNAT superfamily N-acetyltransferase
MTTISLRAMRPDERAEVADLIYVSTNYWYQKSGRPPIFSGDPSATELFCQVYEALDPGCCLVAVNDRTGRLAGSCFYHPRPSHVSLGIMNVHPNYFGLGVARRLLQWILDFADGERKPVRLVSSAMNLDSYSLYTRAGFVPRTSYQDMYVPARTEPILVETPESERVRGATLSDLPAIVALEEELNHISREKDYRHFLENRDGIWHASVLEGDAGGIDGFLVSISHPGSSMLGPGVMRTEAQAAALIAAELNHRSGSTPVFLVPVHRSALVAELYGWGAKNCELHFAQVRGEWREPSGVVMPTFMPETG